MKRQPSLDLIRCLGLLFVVGLHGFLKNGFYSEPQTGALIWTADCFRWLFFSCNGLFLLLTGYLKSTKVFSREYYKSLIPILVSYVLTCAVTYPIRHFVLGEELSLAQWMGKLFGFSNYAWYLEMYIGLILLSPPVNLFLLQIKSNKGLYLAAGVMVFLTAMPSLTPLPVAPDYWTALYPVTFYVLGAVIRRVQPDVKFWQGLGLTALTVMGMALASVMATDEPFSKGFIQGNGGFWNTLVAVLVFLSLYRMQLPERLGKIVSWLAEGCMEGYLLSRIIDCSIYAMLPQWHSPEKYPLLFLSVTIPNYVISILAGKAVHMLAWKIVRPWLTRNAKISKIDA